MSPNAGGSPESEAAPTTPRRGARRRRWALGGFLAGIVVAAILATAAFVVPVRTSFALSVESVGFTPSVEYRTFPSGAAVSFAWNTSDGRTVTFSLLNSDGRSVSSSSAAAGNLSFTADGGAYGFQSYSWLHEVVEVHGTYSAALVR